MAEIPSAGDPRHRPSKDRERERDADKEPQAGVKSAPVTTQSDASEGDESDLDLADGLILLFGAASAGLLGYALFRGMR